MSVRLLVGWNVRNNQLSTILGRSQSNCQSINIRFDELTGEIDSNWLCGVKFDRLQPTLTLGGGGGGGPRAQSHRVSRFSRNTTAYCFLGLESPSEITRGCNSFMTSLLESYGRWSLPATVNDSSLNHNWELNGRITSRLSPKWLWSTQVRIPTGTQKDESPVFCLQCDRDWRVFESRLRPERTNPQLSVSKVISIDVGSNHN